MAKDYKIQQALGRAMAESIDSSTISRAYEWYMHIGGQCGYYEFRKQTKEDLDKLFKSLDEEEFMAKFEQAIKKA